MPVPASPKFDILDWNIRADSTTYADDRLLSDSVDPITQYAFISDLANIVNEDGFTTLRSDAATNVANTTVKTILQVSDELPQPVPQNFTFEFDVYLSDDIPKTFADVNHRVFIGAINQQGYTAGFIFSYDGIALAAYPEDPTHTILGGTKDLIFDDNGEFVSGINIRAVIDGENGRIGIYTSTADDAYALDPDITEAVLTYSLAAKKSTGLYNDCVYLQTSAPSALKLQETNPGDVFTEGEASQVTIGSLRLAGYKAIPEDRPIASASTEYQTIVGQSIQFAGNNSYDPSGKNIDYNWELDIYPEGSNASIQGAAYSVASIEIPGVPDPEVVVTLTYKRPTKRADGYKVILVEGPLESNLTMSWDSSKGELLVSLGRNENGDVVTSAADLVNAFRNSLAPGYDIEIAGGTTQINFSQPVASAQDDIFETNEIVSEQVTYPGIFRADLTAVSSTGTEKLVAGEFTFTGGNGSSLMNPIFIPDKPGTYVVSLKVHNGTRASLPVTETFNAAITNQLLSHRPNSDYLWKYIGDFWKLVPDKHQITSIWSAMTQAVSSDLVTAWQNDYAKAIRDVSRRYQRRWIHYDAKVDIPKGYTASIIQPNSLGKATVDILDVIQGSRTDTATTQEEHAIAPISVGKALLRTTLHTPSVVDVVGVTEAAGVASPKWSITTSGKDFPSFEVLAERRGGYFVADPDEFIQQTPARSTVFTDPTYPITNKLDVARDSIRLYDELGENPRLVRVSDTTPGQVQNTVRLQEGTGYGEIEDQIVDGFARKWDHLRETKNVYLQQSPYILLGDEILLDEYNLGLGDYLNLVVIDPYLSEEVDVSLPILAVGGQCIFVEWYPLLAALFAQSVVVNKEQVWTESDLVNLSIVPKSFVMSRRLNTVPDLVSIPKLGITTINPSLEENIDYSILQSQIFITDWFAGTLATVAGSERVYPESGTLTHTLLSAAFQNAGSLAFLAEDSLGIDTLCLGAGDSSVYKIVEYHTDGSLSLDRPMEHSATGLYYWAPRFGAYNPAPNMFWAEVSYFDNWKTIENNFGLYVGFPKELLEEYDENLDYLSVTKSIWFAFLSGPHFDNLQLGIQSFFDLPYSEVRGQITYIEEPTEFEDGRIFITDENGRGHTYFYPKRANIATNPNTGEPYAALEYPLYWDLIQEDGVYYQLIDGDKFEVDPGVLATMESAKVAAYAKLVDVVKVEDYISDPDLVGRQFSGTVSTYIDEYGNTHIVDQEPSRVEKYHKFIVDVPMDVTQSTAVFPLVKKFLNEAKPAYTDFILVGSLQLSDEISCIDNLLLKPTLTLHDTPHTSPFWAKADGTKTTDEGVQYLDVPKGWPLTNEREELLWPKQKTIDKIASIDYSGLLAQAVLEHAPQNFHVRITPGDYYIVFGQENELVWNTFEYGVCVVPPQGNVPPYQMNWATLTDLGAALHEFPPTNRSIGFFLPGDPNFHIYDTTSRFLTPENNFYGIDGVRISITRRVPIAGTNMNLLTLNNQNIKFYMFDDTAANMLAAFPPMITYWDNSDVFEKYEAGYCEGVLDDYSGDGSWNFNRATLDMVNTVNSDIDVVRSRLMVPVKKDTSAAQEDIEFEVGEPIAIHINGNLATPSIWDEAPPVLLHIGAGNHPKIPAFDPGDATKGIFSPQFDHPNTYLLLGFDRSDTDDKHLWDEHSSNKDYNAYGDESRLDVITELYDATVGPVPPPVITLVGTRSGAIAEIVTPLGDDVVRRANPNHTAFPGMVVPPLYPYFLLETIWQQDKLIEYGPASDPCLFLTKYLPVDSGVGPYPNGTGGITLEDWWRAAPTFDGGYAETSALFGGIISNITAGGGMGADPEVSTIHSHHLAIGDVVPIWNTDQTTIAPGTVQLDGDYVVSNIISASSFAVTSASPVEAGTFGYVGHSPTFHEMSERHEKELQQHPYRPFDPVGEQFIPSNSPGAYSDWQTVLNPSIEKLVYGYKDEGALNAGNSINIQDWEYSPAVTTYLQNIHYGMKVRPRKEYHLTHGFTEFFIPAPTIKMIMPSSAAYDIRICGFYFCNDDPSRVNIPTKVPDEYGDPLQQEGVIGGSWVFFRHTETGIEIPVSEYHFEQGENPGQIISFLGKDRDGEKFYIKGGPGQPSDGHVLELHVPEDLPGFGYYDIIVRNYRPYQMKVNGDWHYHMDEDSVLKAFYHSEEGWGIASWGTSPFGGV